jgi:hypothetical protein
MVVRRRIQIQLCVEITPQLKIVYLLAVMYGLSSKISLIVKYYKVTHFCMECSSVHLCTQKIHVVNYGYSVTQSHSYFQVHLLGVLKMNIRNVAVCDHRNKDRGFHFIVVNYNESSRRIRGSELTTLLSPQVHGVPILQI